MLATGLLNKLVKYRIKLPGICSKSNLINFFVYISMYVYVSIAVGFV